MQGARVLYSEMLVSQFRRRARALREIRHEFLFSVRDVLERKQTGCYLWFESLWSGQMLKLPCGSAQVIDKQDRYGDL